MFFFGFVFSPHESWGIFIKANSMEVSEDSSKAFPAQISLLFVVISVDSFVELNKVQWFQFKYL